MSEYGLNRDWWMREFVLKEPDWEPFIKMGAEMGRIVAEQMNQRILEALGGDKPGTAVPDNCVTGNQPEMPCPVTEPLPKEKRAEVSDKEPVAWAVVGIGYEYVSLLRESAAEAARSGGGVMVPLYRQPQPTLTDSEREDIACAESRLLSMANGPRDEQVAATLRGLLDRTK